MSIFEQNLFCYICTRNVEFHILIKRAWSIGMREIFIGIGIPPNIKGYGYLRDGVKRAVGTPEILAQYRIHQSSRACEKLKVAHRRWKLYRSMLDLTVGESVYYFLQYARAGLRKYQRCSK